MTSAVLLDNDLEADLPGLLAGASVVALVPATDLRGWAAETAWRIARAAARSGRRTALVDCFVDAPTLHAVTGALNDEGITDVFEYGASLNRIVQQQPQANLFFVPAGTYAADAQPLVANPRWRRLSAGFRHEDALLLLYVSPEHLGTLAAEPDGMVVLSPIGLDTTVAEAPAVAEALARGLTLLAVVADPDSMRISGAHRAVTADDGWRMADGGKQADGGGGMADGGKLPAAAPTPSAAIHQPLTTIPWRGVVIVLVLIAALAGLAAFLVLRPRSEANVAPADSGSAAIRQPPAAISLPPAETLALAVPVASLPSLSAAFAVLDSIEAAGRHGIIAPLRLAGRPAVFRVYAGPYGWNHTGPADTVPWSLPLTGTATLDAARAERARLRGAGVPAFIVGQADGTFRLYAGAYPAAMPPAHLADLLTPTGSAGELAPRVGYLP